MTRSPRWRHVGRVGYLLIGLGVVAVAAGGIVHGTSADIDRLAAVPVALACSFGPLSLFLLHRIPGHPIGRLMAGAGLCAGVDCLAICWSAWEPAAWLTQWLWWPAFGFVPLALLIFPDGQLPSRRWRSAAAAVATASVGAGVALAVGASTAPRTFITGDAPVTPTAQATGLAAILCVSLVVLLTAAIGVSLVLRWRRAETVERRQILCLAPCCILLTAGIPLSALNVPAAWLPGVVALPVGLTFAILRFQLLDLDLYIHRGLVWTLILASIVSIYALAVSGVGFELGSRDPRLTTLVAGLVVALLFLPIERSALRIASRLLFGRRDDPYSILVRASRHIEGIRDPLDVLPRLAVTLSNALRVPYVAIELVVAEGAEPLIISHGRPSTERLQPFPMIAHGRAVGQLLVATRRPGEHFTVSEQRLLSGLATQAAVAAEACGAALDLQRARERLVTAREEERRQLRDDLHDGVASSLVGARLLAAKAISEEGHGRSARDLLAELDRELVGCTSEVRTLITGLRPAALDHGLEEALRRSASSSGLQTIIHVSGDVDSVPAAVEVAAYRIVTEAVTNVRKHTSASACDVTVSRTPGALELRIQDNGRRSVKEPISTRGVGLESMKSRVGELGGRIEFTSGGHGFCVAASLPIPEDSLTTSKPPAGPDRRVVPAS